MKIPFLDLTTPHRELEEELVASVRSALRSARPRICRRASFMRCAPR